MDAHVPTPSELTRLGLLLRRTLVYYWRCSTYWLRGLEMLIIALFIGTLFLRLTRETKNLTQVRGCVVACGCGCGCEEVKECVGHSVRGARYVRVRVPRVVSALAVRAQLAGALFYNIWAVLFAVIAAAPAFATDRRHARAEILGGQYKVETYCAAQFAASLPYFAVIALAYQVAHAGCARLLHALLLLLLPHCLTPTTPLFSLALSRSLPSFLSSASCGLINCPFATRAGCRLVVQCVLSCPCLCARRRSFTISWPSTTWAKRTFTAPS